MKVESSWTGSQLDIGLDRPKVDLPEVAGLLAVVAGEPVRVLDYEHAGATRLRVLKRRSEDDWGWEQLRPWLEHRAEMPIGALFSVLNGPTCGRPWSAPAVRAQLRQLAVRAGVRRRFAPHQLRHAHAVEMARRACRST